MLHPDIRIKYLDAQIGYGLYATTEIPKGTITYIQDELEVVLSDHSYKRLDKNLKFYADKYTYRDAAGNRILSWDLAKYMNHCCFANTLSTAYGFDLAVRDIAANEEVTCDYGLLNIDSEMVIHCRLEGCRGVLRVDDFEDHVAEWDRLIKSALSISEDVAQPLVEYLGDAQVVQLAEFYKDPFSYRSISETRYLRSKTAAMKATTDKFGINSE